MPLSLITLLIVAVICLILGGIAGILLGSMGGDQEEAAPGSQDEAPPGGRKGHYSPIVRLWREKSTGAIVVEVDGKSYLAPAPLRPDQVDRLAQVARDFFTWMGNSEAEIPLSARRSVPLASPVENLEQPRVTPPAARVEPPQPAVVSKEAAPVQKQGAPMPDLAASPVHVPVKPPQSANQAAIPSSARPAKAPAPAVETPKTIVQQIDAVLQSIIAGTPYEDMGISLTEDPRRGVVVWIGPSSYEGSEGVADPEIQKIIRSAVAEWERREDSTRRRG